MPDWGGGNTNWSSGDWFNRDQDNYGATQTDPSTGSRVGAAGSGAVSGCAAGSVAGPWGCAVGGLVGGLTGWLGSGPEDLSPAEQRVNNWDIMMNQAQDEMGPQMLGGWAENVQDVGNRARNLMAQGGPDLSGATAEANRASANVGRLSNYQPTRIDRQMKDWRGLMKHGMGSIINPAMLASNQQYSEQEQAMLANPTLSGHQRAAMQGEGRRGLAQTNAQIQGEAIQTGMSALDDLAAKGDALVQRSLEAAAAIGVSVAKLKADLAALPYDFQFKMLDLLQRNSAEFARFMTFLRPGDQQYAAATAGGQTGGTDWAGMINAGATAYQNLSGGGGGNVPNYNPGASGAEIDYMSGR